MSYMWVVEILNEKSPGSGGKWVAWEGQAFESRRDARKNLEYHKAGCWTQARIRKYIREETK